MRGVVGFGLLNAVQLTPSTTAAAPSMTVSPSSLSFSGTAGGSNPPAQQLTVSDGGAWTASANQSWIALSPGSGSLSVQPSISGLGAGT